MLGIPLPLRQCQLNKQTNKQINTNTNTCKSYSYLCVINQTQITVGFTSVSVCIILGSQIDICDFHWQNICSASGLAAGYDKWGIS